MTPSRSRLATSHANARPKAQDSVADTAVESTVNPRQGTLDTAGQTASPAGLDAFRQRLDTAHERLPKRLREVNDYVRNNPQSIALDTVAVAASKAGVSPSTLVRYARHFGLDGYSDLQALHREPLYRRYANYAERLQHTQLGESTAGENQTAALLEDFASAQIASLHALLSHRQGEALERALEAMSAARHLHIVGVRRAHAVSLYMQYALSQIGQPCTLVDGHGGMMPEQMLLAHPDDLVIVFTFSPYSSFSLQALKVCRARNTRVLLITDTVNSEVTDNADIVLIARDAEAYSFRSLASALCIAQTLCIALGKHKLTAHE